MNTSTTAPLRRSRLLIVALLVGWLSGCGGSSETEYHLSGQATFDGQPIPAGRIMFTPDGGQQNTGSPGYATIKDGAFNTNSTGGKPHVGGPMVIRIEARKPTGELQPDPENPGQQLEVFEPLFPTYETKAVLAAEETTQDFDVPATAAQRVDQREGSGSRGP